MSFMLDVDTRIIPVIDNYSVLGLYSITHARGPSDAASKTWCQSSLYSI
jgi:hypothetical protein